MLIIPSLILLLLLQFQRSSPILLSWECFCLFKVLNYHFLLLINLFFHHGYLLLKKLYPYRFNNV